MGQFKSLEEVADSVSKELADTPARRELFVEQISDYVELRKRDPNRPHPMANNVDFDYSRPTLEQCECCFILATIHDKYCSGDQKLIRFNEYNPNFILEEITLEEMTLYVYPDMITKFDVNTAGRVFQTVKTRMSADDSTTRATLITPSIDTVEVKPKLPKPTSEERKKRIEDAIKKLTSATLPSERDRLINDLTLDQLASETDIPRTTIYDSKTWTDFEKERKARNLRSGKQIKARPLSDPMLAVRFDESVSTPLDIAERKELEELYTKQCTPEELDTYNTMAVAEQDEYLRLFSEQHEEQKRDSSGG